MLYPQDSCNEANTPDHTSDNQALVVTDTQPGEKEEEEDKNVDVLSDLFEKLYLLNKKLEEQEDDIFRLTVQMEAMCQTKTSAKTSSEAGAEGVIHTELKIAQEELDTMAKLNSRLGYEIKRNELALSNMMNNYDGRRQFAQRLEADVSKVETAAPAPAPARTTPPAKPALNKIEVWWKRLKHLFVDFYDFSDAHFKQFCLTSIRLLRQLWSSVYNVRC